MFWKEGIFLLKLSDITKVYGQGGSRVEALRGVSITFRESEFVAILGHSGCGKTTLLNIIGGLDQYTSGDLTISGRSTKDFKDRDWDAYRNHSIGFVFQSYNLIPHQSVLANVELALTLSGVSRTERRRRAVEALTQVGLADQLHKRPNQMSGGQMQRVAIARALVNDPEILLADEPTGALDSETSVQIMELLKAVAQDRLVIMVTHNPELAQRYATRTVRLLDGQIIADSAPYDGTEHFSPKKHQHKRLPSMSFGTALGLSMHNLLTKKGRTVLTALAGAIGIIGIALILSLSTGIQSYIDQVQEDTLSSYPIDIQAETVDMTSMMSAMMSSRNDQAVQEPDRVYASTVMYDMMNAMTSSGTESNDLKSFRDYLEQETCPLLPHVSALQYSYDLNLDIYTQDPSGTIIRSDVMELIEDSMDSLYGEGASGLTSAYMGNMGGFGTLDVWEEILPGESGEVVSDLVREQYDLVYGDWPQAYDEVVLVIDEKNQLSDLMLYALGLKDQAQMAEVTGAALSQKPIEADGPSSWSYEELCGKTYKLVLPSACFEHDPVTGGYSDLRETEAGLEYLYNSTNIGVTLRVVGILRPNPDATATMLSGAMGYTSLLSDYVLDHVSEQPIVEAQISDPTVDVFTGLPFATGQEMEHTDLEKKEAFLSYLENCSTEEKAAMYLDAASQPDEDFLTQTVAQQTDGLTRADIEAMVTTQYAQEMGVDIQTITDYIAEMDDETLFARVEEAMRTQIAEQYAAAVRQQLSALSNEQLAQLMDLGGNPDTPLTLSQYAYLYDNYMPPTVSDATLEENLERLGYVDRETPSSIRIYAATFADKDAIADEISAYNNAVPEEQQITYTDYVALLMSSITTIIQAISYVLIAFVAISLVVSSIMIGIITYISVLERTKEIGILRSIGASKGDISQVFNAETLIEGFVSGAMGIGVTLLLLLPINAMIHHLTGIESLNAFLPWQAALILVAISMVLTLIAGLIPSRFAAKKDPVEALRTE